MKPAYVFHYCILLALILPNWLGASFANDDTQAELAVFVAAKTSLQQRPADVDALTVEALPKFVKEVESAMRLIARARNQYFGETRRHLSTESRLRLRYTLMRLQKTPQPVLVYANDSLRFRKSIYLMLEKAYGRLGQVKRAKEMRALAHLALERPTAVKK